VADEAVAGGKAAAARMGYASSQDDVNDDRNGMIDSNKIACAFAAFGIFCGIFTLVLIADMRSQKVLKISGYTILIISLTSTQMLYDVGVILESIFPMCKYVCARFKVGEFLTLFFGLVATEITNVLMFVVSYTIMTLRFYSVSRHVYTIFGSIGVSSFIIAVITMHPSSHYSAPHSIDDDSSLRTYFLYEYLRVISIFFNLVVLGLISVVFYRRGIFYCCRKSSYLRDRSAKNSVDEPLAELVRRLALYPVVQILTRIPKACLFFAKTALRNKSIYSVHDFYRLNIMDGIFTPSAGIGFAIIFLVITPRAYRHFLKRCFGIVHKANEVREGEEVSGKKNDLNEKEEEEEEEGTHPSISIGSSKSNRSSITSERQSSIASCSQQQVRLSNALMLAAHVSQLDEEDLGILIENANLENKEKNSSAPSSTRSSEVEMPPPPPSLSLDIINPLQTV